MIKKTAWLGCHHFYCCLEPSFPVILVFSPPPSLLRFCDWNRHHEGRQVEDAVLCVLLILAVGNRPLIGCFLSDSPLCCACDTTCVTRVFFGPLPGLLILAAQNFWTSLWRPVLPTRQGQQRVMVVQKLCESVAISSNSRNMRQKTPKKAHYQRESLLNNSHSHTSCFYSRRLRPQTPQRSDDEGGKRTLAVPQLCVSLQAKKDLPGSFILCK